MRQHPYCKNCVWLGEWQGTPLYYCDTHFYPHAKYPDLGPRLCLLAWEDAEMIPKSLQRSLWHLYMAPVAYMDHEWRAALRLATRRGLVCKCDAETAFYEANAPQNDPSAI